MSTNDLLEYAGITFGLLFVILESRNSILCWSAGIIQSILGVVLMYRVNLYAESILYGFYILTGVIGWYRWSLQKGSNSTVQEWSFKRHIYLFLSGVMLYLLLFFVFDTYTDADAPAVDSFTTAFSIIGTILLIERVLSTWYYWIPLNAVTIYLYAYKDMEFYAGYFVLMTGISVYGLITWKKIYSQQQ